MSIHFIPGTRSNFRWEERLVCFAFNNMSELDTGGWIQDKRILDERILDKRILDIGQAHP